MIDRVRRSVGPAADVDLCTFARGAAALLRARGVPLSAHRVSSLARLARSFAREGMGRIEALHAAAALAVRRR